MIAAILLLFAILGFFVFPGHTYLQSDTQIYIPMLERAWDPSVFGKDMVAEVTRRLDDPRSAHVAVARNFAEVLARPGTTGTIAVDMPIGLAEHGGIGGRQADREARLRLGARASSVFAVPARVAVMEHEYAAACATAFAHSDPPRKISKQMFFLFPKIREVDALMTPHLQTRVVECHPELAFWALNGERPLSEPKKVRGRPHAPGLALRRDLLAAAGYDRDWLAARHVDRRDAGPDDVLDAAANAWTAARIATGTARRFPSAPACDIRGLRMEIWA